MHGAVPVDRFCVVESGIRVSRSRRFTIVVADRRTGAYRRFGVRLAPVLSAVAFVFTLPVLVGLRLRWSALSEIDGLRAAAERLDIENRNFRAATGELTSQLQSLQAVVTELGAKASVDSDTARAMDRLPQMVKAQAAGGPLMRLPSSRWCARTHGTPAAPQRTR